MKIFIYILFILFISIYFLVSMFSLKFKDDFLIIFLLKTWAH